MLDNNLLWKEGTRFGRPVILTAMVILIFPVFTPIIYVFVMFLSYECSARHMAQVYKSHLYGLAACSSGKGLFCPQDRTYDCRSTPQVPQVSAQHITVKHFQFWLILTYQAENWRFRSSFLIWSDAAVSGAAASVRRGLCATGVITDLAICRVLVSLYVSARTFNVCTCMPN